MIENFEEVVNGRRSVREFMPDEVPAGVIDKCIDLALLAPSSSNLQPWEFYWVKTLEKKTKLAQYCMSQSAATTAPVLIVCVACPKKWKVTRKKMLESFDKLSEPAPKLVRDYYEKLVPFVYSQGICGIFGLIKKILFAVVGVFRVVPREPTSLSDMKIWAVKSTALACENLMLAFRAYGYDTCPMEGIDSLRVKKLNG